MKLLMRYILVFVAMGTITSCKKFLDVNTSPNSPTKAPINGLLASTTENTAINVFSVGNTTSYYVQYLASPNTGSPTDTYDKIDLSTVWGISADNKTGLYDNMTDIYDLEKLAIENGATQYQGVAKVLMTMNLQLVHNLWGAAPYSTAFTTETLTPTYDEATAIFQKCLSLLDEGITLLQQTGSKITIPTGATSVDLIHQGNTSKWIKTAHALKARLLNQLSKTNQYNPSAIFTELAAAYTSPSDSAAVTVFDIRNPWNNVAVLNAGQILQGWLSEYYVNAMNGTSFGIFDPRLPLIGTLTKNNDYKGTRNGAGRGASSGVNKDESYLSTTGYYSSPKSPVYIINYEEMKFIEAEVAFRTNDKPRAYAAYLEGIKANMNKVGVLAAARDAYVNHPSVSVGSAALTLELIFREKWKALFLMPVSWDDARRFNYGYQGFQLPLNVLTSTFIRRLVYPAVEISRNSTNVPLVTDVTQKLWWDQ